MSQETVWLMFGIGAAAMSGFAMAAIGWSRRKSLLVSANPMLAALTPLCIFVLVSGLLLAVWTAPRNTWDSARIAACIAFLRGLEPYSRLNDGSIQTTMYPPGWLLAYSPCSLANTPLTALLIGNVLAVAYTMVPFAVGAWLLSRRLLLTVLVTEVFMVLVYTGKSTWWVMVSPHADAPALGCALLSALAIATAMRSPAYEQRAYGAAAFAAMCAVWCKQVMLPVPIALLIWSFLWRGWRRSLPFAMMLAAVGAVLTLASVWMASPEGLWLNLVTIPSHCPWRGQIPFNLLTELLVLLWDSLGALLLMIVVAAFALAQMQGPRFREWLKESVWPILFLLFVCMLPMAVMARVKEGGWLNCLGLAEYFIQAAVCIQVLEVFLALQRPNVSNHARHSFSWGVIGLVGCVSVVAWLSFSQEVRRSAFTEPLSHPEQEAYAFLVAHPDGACFPSHPLVHLLAEGYLSHYVQAVADRHIVADLPIQPAHLAKYWNTNAVIVAWSLREHSGEQTRGKPYFAQFRTPVGITELPSFRCYRRTDAAATNAPGPQNR